MKTSKNVIDLLSPTKWVIKLLGLSEKTSKPDTPGLVMIQIDGLAARHLETAIHRGLMPFMKKLYREGQYQLWPHYSGIPSNTPSVQGEIFYGIKQLVPAFNFKDRSTNQIFKMYQSSSASSKEAEGMSRGAEPLLEGGSSYGNIFAGGAKESHYTASTFGNDEIRRFFDPKTVAVILFFNFHIVIRSLILTTVELYLAAYDFLRGVITGFDCMSELKFIPTRVGVSVILRELIVAGAKIDVARGLPIIHLNLFGYDEQAHRRGPSSWFAYWSLRGIDSAIRRVYKSARSSGKRDYDIWIYSDHGQEESVPFCKVAGKPIAETVQEVFGRVLPAGKDRKAYGYFRDQCDCRQSRSGKRNPAIECIPQYEEGLIVTAMGPIGFIYPPFRLSDDETETVAQELAAMGKVPVVLAVIQGRLRVWNSSGRHEYEAGMRIVLGPDHPYIPQIIADVRRLCAHADAGAFTILGWHAGRQNITFPDEHGAHGGIGPEETNGFALLPSYAPLRVSRKSFIVPMDIRNAALAYMNRGPETLKEETSPDASRKTAGV